MNVGHRLLFDEVISRENIFLAWKEFRRGKRRKKDVQIFERYLEDNLSRLHWELENGLYQHGGYQSFVIRDPKLRIIHKASVKDRVLHHALFRILYLFYNPTFVDDSYACRNEKGSHAAVARLADFLQRESRNFARPVYALKCDIRKFFASIDHKILKEILSRRITDTRLTSLLSRVIDSYHEGKGGGFNGLPIGNLTSQLFANLYLNQLDVFIKHTLRIKKYLRYSDDFIIVHHNKEYLEELISVIKNFVERDLKMSLHPQKIILRKFSQGIDFLGYVMLPYYRVLRTKTKQRMIWNIKTKRREFQDGKISKKSFEQSVASTFGVLKHCNGRGLKGYLKRAARF